MQTNDGDRPYDDTPIDNTPRNQRRPVARWIVIAASLVGLAGAGYGVRSHGEAARIAESQQAGFKKTVSDLQQQVQILQDRLAAKENQESQRATIRATARTPAAARPSSARITAMRAPRPVDDTRITNLERKFSGQEEKLASTQRMVESTRSDLETRIDSTSEALNGSIARTSDEVAVLRRRGERDYVEFNFPKSKSMQRVGPISVALRKTDVKHKRYNLDLTVDDNRVEKKNVNLLEPVYITSPDWPQPLELVVNRIEKDRISGYVSTPKYKRSELASSSTQRLKLEPQPSGIPKD